jgi:hypothetical protein
MSRVSRQEVIRQDGSKTEYFDTQKQQFVMKCISKPRDDSSHQKSVIHNFCVETNSDYQSK